MKTVFSTSSECAHVFASQTQEYGRAGNMSFRGSIAFSYGHYEIAQIVDTKKRRALIQSNTYSMSTSRHVSRVRSALSHYDTIYAPTVDNSLKQHTYNLSYFKHAYDSAVDKGKRSIKCNPYEDAKQALTAAKKYASWFPGCKKSLPVDLVNFVNRSSVQIDKLRQAKDIEISERQARLNDPDRINQMLEKKHISLPALVEKARIEYECSLLQSIKVNNSIDAWKAHKEESVENPYYNHNNFTNFSEIKHAFHVSFSTAVYIYNAIREKIGTSNQNFQQNAFLRLSIDGTRIETSMQAQVLMKSAVELWPIIHRSFREKAKYSGNGFKIDYYTVDSIDKGNLTIGCHKVSYLELRLMAKQLNLIQ